MYLQLRFADLDGGGGHGGGEARVRAVRREVRGPRAPARCAGAPSLLEREVLTRLHPFLALPRTLHVAYFRDVKNSAELRQATIDQQLDAALINAQLVRSTLPIAAAADLTTLLWTGR